MEIFNTSCKFDELVKQFLWDIKNYDIKSCDIKTDLTKFFGPSHFYYFDVR